MANYYPPVGFHFKVEFQGLDKQVDHDVRFTDVGGLSLELATEEVAEGGQNRFLQKYPVRAKHPELVLKRGLLTDSGIIDWVRACIEDFDITPKNLDIKLLNDKHEPLMTWHVINAWPTRWNINDLSASSNSVVVENLHLFYQQFNLDRG
jgi:phage tail-like protein